MNIWCRNLLPGLPYTKKTFLWDSNWDSVKSLQELRDIAASNSNVRVLQIDLKDYDKYPEIVAQVQDVVKDEGLNVLFNSAGISPRSSFLGLKALKASELMDVYAVNVVAPLMLSRAFVPLLKKASDTKKDAPLGVQRAVIVNMSKFSISLSSLCASFHNPFQVQSLAQSLQTRRALCITIVSLSQDWMPLQSHWVSIWKTTASWLWTCILVGWRLTWVSCSSSCNELN